MGRKTRQTGYTLVEIMITIAVLAILVSLAVPGYFQYVVRANRSEGIEALMTAAACQERLLIRNNAYDADACEGTTQGGHYAVTVVTSNSNQNFVATAAPQGGQSRDSCGSLALSDTGVKSAGGSTGALASKCWGGKYGSS